MRVFKRICMLVTGFVLFLAGLLKLMDPVGAGLQMEAYFQFLHIAFLSPLSGVAAWSASLFETVLGAAVITGVWKKPVGKVTWCVLVFFTVLTFVMWLADPPMECGCFGEAVHLTHAQSLLKNIALLVLWAVTYIPSGQFEEPGRRRYAGFAIASCSAAIFSLVCLLTIPPVDFTSLNPGTELVDEGVSSLSFYDASGDYADSLATEGEVIVLSVYDPDRLSGKKWEKISAFMDMVAESGMLPVLLVATAPDELPEGAFAADRRTLMTLNRSNGGAVYVSDGQIIKKWSSRSYPEKDDLKVDLVSANTPSRMALQGFILFEIFVMLLI